MAPVGKDLRLRNEGVKGHPQRGNNPNFVRHKSQVHSNCFNFILIFFVQNFLYKISKCNLSVHYFLKSLELTFNNVKF